MSFNTDSEPTRAAGKTDGRPGALKIYLGYASHTGKTWRLLEEARRRKGRGEDVVVGWLRQKDEAAVAEMLPGLEIVPPVATAGQPAMDCEAILRRAPDVCVIDELAHINPPCSRNLHRWQDVNELLAAGIDVVTAMNIQYVAGLQPSIGKLLGNAPSETVPDDVVRKADEIVLVDASPESVLKRPPAAGENPPSERCLLALRELALRFSASAVEEDVREYRQEHHIETVWETQERILVCVTAYTRGPHLVERAHQAADRWKGELWAIYVTPDAEMSNLSPEDAERVRSFLDLARSKEARVEIVEDEDPVHGILSFAARQEITQIFLGHAAAYPFRGALSHTVAGRILHAAAGMDVNVVADDPAAAGQGPPPTPDPALSFLARLLAGAPRDQGRGHQRIYLGYAPGVGKTFQMLLDGQYLRDRGQDVVVGYCDPRGRKDVIERLSTFELVAPLEGGGVDLEGIVRRRPQLCLVDGLADLCAGGKRRWQNLEVLLDAGIHVFATLDVSEVESLKDTVQRITGLPVVGTVPDWMIDEANEVIFVDAAIRALLNRVKRGVVFPGTEVPESLRTLFTEGSLNALRELAMRLTADRVEDELEALEQKPAQDTREALLVCAHQRPSGASAIRRARRVADRLGVPVYAVYVAPDEDWTGVAPEHRAATEEHLELARTLHLETHVLYGSNVARMLVDFAIRHGVTRIFMGRSYKTGWREFFQRSVIEQVIRLSPGTDVCIVAER
ncbi:MAG: universal stress protein [Armatimonadetes bacterium]|nr:universal stress protein [Armatimonadota bacterium]